MAAAEETLGDDMLACQRDYDKQTRLFRTHGVSTDEAARSAGLVARARGGRAYLGEWSYQPTGLALGVPLPSRAFEQQLLSVSKRFDDALAKALGGGGPCFALVPSKAYHVTVLNRSHFEAGNTISILSAADLKKIQAVTARLFSSPPRIKFRGLVLTGAGRMIVPGTPADGELFAARRALAARFPSLACQVPVTAHIKLGHVLLGVDRDAIPHVVRLVDQLGEEVRAVLRFTSIYSPAGRIPLTAGADVPFDGGTARR